MPRLAAFPKAWMDDLCVTGKMTIRQWVALGATLGVDGLEFYSGFLDLQSVTHALEARRMVEDFGLSVPMFCCSPDFTHPDPTFRQQQVDLEKGWIDMCSALGGQFCRVLSGQRRPEVSREEGIRYAAGDPGVHPARRRARDHPDPREPLQGQFLDPPGVRPEDRSLL